MLFLKIIYKSSLFLYIVFMFILTWNNLIFCIVRSSDHQSLLSFHFVWTFFMFPNRLPLYLLHLTTVILIHVTHASELSAFPFYGLYLYCLRLKSVSFRDFKCIFRTYAFMFNYTKYTNDKWFCIQNAISERLFSIVLNYCVFF